MTATDLYDPATALTPYYPTRADRTLARLWANEKAVHDAQFTGLVAFFEGNAGDLSTLEGFAATKLWLQADEGVTTEPGQVKVWTGESPASSPANWVEVTPARMLNYLRRAAGETTTPSDSPLVNVADFNAVGDWDGSTGTNNNTPLTNALAASTEVYLPPGNYYFSDSGVLTTILRSTIYGSGRLYYDTGSSVEQVGSFFRAGVCDSGNNQGFIRQGGFVIGGEGPGVNGALLYAAHPAWPVIQPQRYGSAVEFQIYNSGHNGLAVTVDGTAYIDATYGNFASPDFESGDVLGYGSTLYKIKTRISNTRLELETLAGGAVTFVGATTESYYHAYYYGEGVCSTDGTSVTWLSGDYFFGGAAIAGQNTLTINGVRYPISSFSNERAITLGSSAGQQANVNFRQKFFSTARNSSLFRIQALSGGVEENLAIYHRVDGLFVIDSQATTGTGAHHRPVAIATGSNYDAPGGTETMHVVVSGDGQIGIGKNYASPLVGFPTSAKLHVWRDPRVSQTNNGSNDTLLLNLHSTHNGSDARHMVFGTYNNNNAGYIQGWINDALSTPGIIAFNPQGGNVGVGTGTSSSIPSALSVYDNTSLNASVGYPLTLRHLTTGTPGLGIGVGAAFGVETADGNVETVGTLDFVTTDVTGGSEDTDFVVKLQAAGGALAQKFRVLSTGIIQFGTHSAIGSETVTGYITVKDAAGNDRKLAVVS